VNSQVELTVPDNGIGIKPEQLSVIFERFQQAETSSTRRYGGLGLGLAISKSLVELHGGSIFARSPGLGEGTSFRVSLPLPAMHEAEPAPGLPQHPSATPSNRLEQALPKLEGIRILVIDDDADSRELLKTSLAKSGAEVQTVDSAPGALEKADAQLFDVLVSDIGMPVMSGIDLIKELRNREHSPNRHTPAIALTAFAATEDRKRALLAGFDSFLSKPVDLGEVIAVVSRMASRRR
jgi:CheY-like chemotaxis protein